MNITEADILRYRKEGAWRKLAGIASTIVADAQKVAGSLRLVGDRNQSSKCHSAAEARCASQTKFDAISDALEAMRLLPKASSLWDAVQAPNRPALNDVLEWAVGQLAEYRKAAQGT